MRIDKTTLEIEVREHKRDSEIVKLNKELGEAGRKYRSLQNEVDKLTDKQENGAKLTEAETKKLAELKVELEKTKTDYQRLDQQKTQYVKDNKLETMTIHELSQEYRTYRQLLQNLDPNSNYYKETKNYVDALKNRMAELNKQTVDTKNSLQKFSEGINFGQLKTILSANFLAKLGGMAFDKVADLASRAFNRVKELVVDSVEVARQAQGITHAFQQLDKPDLLENLRKATHGTVTDLELMKAAVQAQDFRLPLDQLGKYLEFAQLKAQQTGQSVDYLTNSIVTGLGRKSPQILDNLGISASQIKEEMARGGDMAEAVGRIIDQQLSEQGEHFVTAAEREEQAVTDVSNAQLALGNQMQETFGIGSTSFKEMQAKAETFVLNGLTKTIVYLQNLYDKMVTVRVAVEAVKVVFDTVFKVCEVGFLWLIDTVKGVGRLFRDLGVLIESVFTFDWKNIKDAAKSLTDGITRTVEEFAKDGNDVGTRWGNNLVDSVNAVTGKKKIKAPEMEPPKKKTIDNVTTNTDNKKKTSNSNTKETDPYTQELAAREKANREWNNALRQMLMTRMLTEEEYHEESAQAELKFLADKMALQEKYGKDTSETLGQYLDKTISETNRKQKAAEQQLQQELKQLSLQFSQQEADLLRQRKEGLIATDEEYNQKRVQAELEYHRQRLSKLKEGSNEYYNEQARIYQIEIQQAASAAERKAKELQMIFSGRNADGTTGSQMNTQEKMDLLNQNAEILGWQRTQEMKTQILQEEEQKRQQIQQEAFSAASQLLQSTSSLFSALQQRETAAVDAKYKKLIAAAKKQGKDTTKLEEQQEAEKAAIQKKYAQKQFRMQILQIIAATAQSIANVWKEWAAYPPVAAALSAVAAAQGTIQLATAKAQADQAAGLYEGGYSDEYQEGFTRKGDPRKQAGVIPVHQGEFVANHRAVANPDIRPILNVIDRHQKMGDIAMLNTPRMLSEAYGIGLQRGGFNGSTGGGSHDSAPGGYPPGQGTADSSALLPILERIERNTAQSLTVRTLRDEIRHEESLESRAHR